MHSSSNGGLDRFFNGLVSELSRLRVSHRAAVFGGPTPADSNEVSFGPATMSGWKRLWKVREAANEYFRGRTFPMIASHFAFYAFPLIDLLRVYPHVVHFHGPWSGESAVEGESRGVVWAKRQIEQFVYRSADRVIVLSAAFRDLLVKDFQIDPARIVIIPGAIDSAAFLPSVSRQEARLRLGLPANRPIVLCVRRLVQRMGLEELIRAMAIVRTKIPNALLLIGGQGPLQVRLNEQIVRLGLSEQVRLLGFLPETDLPLAYRAADLSIVPSQALEGFGLTTLESLAAGTPVLVTPVGGLPEAVLGLNESLVLTGKTEGEIAQGLIAALARQLPLPLEKACQAYVSSKFDWKVVTPQILKVYGESVVGYEQLLMC